MEYVLRFLLCLLKWTLIVVVVVSLCTASFTFAMDYANISILVSDGMKMRTGVVLGYSDAQELPKFFDEGYATAISRAESYIMSAVPSREMADGAFRRVVRDYPQRAVRELLSNTVIHQDLYNATVGPTVGIYSNRIEFSNPGVSLVPPERMLNALPRTRNNALAGLLRQMDLCEEGGTGWDRIIESCEGAMMMAPKIESDEQVGTKVTLFAGSGYNRMTRRQRMDAAYWHACLLYSRGESMNNQSLRERFGLTSEQKSTVAISRLLRDCCTEGLIREEDEEASAKFKRYIPAWA